MKTTLDLDDDLLIEAKSLAAKRRTTLRAMVEHALRREIQPESPELPEHFVIGPLGLPVLKRPPGTPPMTLEDIQALEDRLDEEEFQRALGPDRQ